MSCYPMYTSHRLTTVEEANNTIISLKDAIRIVDIQRRRQKDRVDDIIVQIKLLMAEKNLESARNAFNKKKMIEKTIINLGIKIDNLESQISTIEAAVMDTQIVMLQGESAVTLKKILSQVGGVENVHDAMDNLRDTIDDVGEIGIATSENLTGPISISNVDELDRELYAFINAESSSGQDDLVEIPLIPTTELDQFEILQGMHASGRGQRTPTKSQVVMN